MEIFQDMNWIDGIITGTLLLSSVWGFFRGLVRGVFGILALVASFVAAQKYGAHLGGAMAVLLGESVVSSVLGYVLVFVAGMTAFGVLTYFVRKAVAGADFGMLDKFGGLVFGAFRGVIIGALFILLLAAFPLQQAQAWRESVMVPMLGGALNAAANLAVLKDYKEHIQFDSGNRPRLSVDGAPSPKTANAECDNLFSEEGRKLINEATGHAQKRDDLLDELNNEMTEQSLHNNASARRNAVALKDKLRKESFMQKVGGFLGELGRGIRCGGGRK